MLTQLGLYYKVARQFAGEDGWIIVLSEPLQARDIQAYTALRGGEHLYPPMRQFEVIDVDEKAKTIRIAEVPAELRTTLPADLNFSTQNRGAEDQAWWDDVRRRIQEARNGPPLEGEKKEAMELVADHMLYC